jgi:osmoprotectant transport system substrate-binding protein
MNHVTRAQALAAFGATVLAAGCARPGSQIAVGSKNFAEEELLGEIYAQALEAHGLAVKRVFDLGGTQIAMAALGRGEIDMYPEYTGTALLVQLKEKPLHDARAIYDRVKTAYAKDYDLVWLTPAPMNDTQALATTAAIAARYHLRTLSDLAKAAPLLRLGAVPEFVSRPDGLPGLQAAYGGFHFKETRLIDIGLKYAALMSGDVDVVVAFGTDAEIDIDHLVVFIDDKHVWPVYQAAPVVRRATLDAHPVIATALDAIAPHLTDTVMRHLNGEMTGSAKRDTAAVAKDFLASIG